MWTQTVSLPLLLCPSRPIFWALQHPEMHLGIKWRMAHLEEGPGQGAGERMHLIGLAPG